MEPRLISLLAGLLFSACGTAPADDAGADSSGTSTDTPSDQGNTPIEMKLVVDSAFGKGGYSTWGTEARTRIDTEGVVVLPDGKALVFATNELYSEGQTPLLLRLNPDGTLDPTFGHNGVAHVPVSGEASYVAVQSDGKLIVSGNTVEYLDVYDWELRSFVTRLSADGLPDPTFGVNGVFRALPYGMFWGSQVDKQDRALLKILRYVSETESYVDVVRLTPDGEVDPSFQYDRGAYPDPITSVLLDDAGRLMALRALDGVLGITRLRDDGTSDPSFGDGGTVWHDLTEDAQNWSAVDFAADGSLVSIVSTPEEKFFARFGPDGAHESNYGADSLAVFFPNNDGPSRMAVLPNGQIRLGDNRWNEYRIGAFSSAGSFVPGYGEGDVGGIARFSIEQGEQIQTALHWNDGSSWLLGHINAGVEGRHVNDVRVRRVTPDGRLDLEFGDDGNRRFGVSASRDRAEAVVHLNDDKLLVAGNGDPDAGWLARFRPDGSLDSSYGQGGLLSLAPIHQLETMTKDSAGRIYVCGVDLGDADSRVVVFRMRADGTPDDAYGKHHVDSQTSSERCSSLVLLPDSGLLVGTRYAFYRLDETGAQDASFAEFGFIPANGAAYADVGDDGIIYAAGSWNYLVGRYNARGRLLSKTPFADERFEGVVVGVQVASDGAVFVLALLSNEEGTHADEIWLTKIRKNGDLSNAYGDGGVFRAQVDQPPHDFDLALAFADDGSAYIAGSVAGPTDRMFLLELDPTGKPRDSIVLGDVGPWSARAITFDGESGIVLAGLGWSERGALDAGLTRLKRE